MIPVKAGHGNFYIMRGSLSRILCAVVAFIFFLLLSPMVAAAYEDTAIIQYTPYGEDTEHTLSVNYIIKGVTGVSADKSGGGVSSIAHKLNGDFSGNTINLSGTATVIASLNGELEVELRAVYDDDQGNRKVERQDYKHTFNPKEGGRQSFNLSLQVPEGTFSVSLRIILKGHSSNGFGYSVGVYGDFEPGKPEEPLTKQVPIWVPHVCVNCPSGVDINTHKGDLYVNGSLGNRIIQGGYRGNHPIGSSVDFRAVPKEGFSFAYWDVWHSQGKGKQRITANPFNFVVPDAMDIHIRATYNVETDKDPTKDPDKTNIPVTGIKITDRPKGPILKVGESYQMRAVIEPEDASNQDIIWSASRDWESNTDYLSINKETGLIVALNPGRVAVSASSAENPKIQDQCRITITEPEKDAPTIIITNCPDQLSVGNRGKFKASVNPSRDPNGKDWRIGWIVDNLTLMNINNDTGTYETIKPGQVTVTAFLHEKPMVQSHCIIMVDKSQEAPEPLPDVLPPSEPPTQDSPPMTEPPAKEPQCWRSHMCPNEWRRWVDAQIDEVIEENERLGISETDIDAGVRFSDFRGEVWVVPRYGGNGYFAELGDTIYAGDIIITYEDSEATLVLSDMSSFHMRPYTVIILDDPRGTDCKWSLVFGTVKANIKSILETGSMETTMNNAVTSIRGTTFWLEETGEESTVWVEEGTVLFTHKNTGESELVSGGYMARATENNLFMVPFDENYLPVNDLQKATPRAFYFLIPAFLAALGFFGVVLYRSRIAPAVVTITIGRDSSNNFIVDDPKVSRVHAEIKYLSGQYLLTDFDSSNGTKVNGNPVQGTVELKPASEVSFGNSSFYFDGKNLAKAPAIETLTIGRDPGNSFRIDDPNVSRFHAQIEYKSGQYLLTDFDSSNGTKVNGNPVQGTVELKPGSEVSFGNSSFYFDGKNLLPND